MTYLVAVSGGVDSVVLLDMLARAPRTKNQELSPNYIVAHVDHGIRGEDSAVDARFVKRLAKQYGLPCVSTELYLGKSASEELARQKRYEFLFAEAKKHRAVVVTAHHQDDLIETIALNHTRGTGWRGLAVMDRSDIYRPLLTRTKQQVYEYALAHHLEWVEDATNASNRYLRNRLRHRLAAATVDTDKLLALRARQLQLRKVIEAETARVWHRAAWSRHFLMQIDETVAIELLGHACQVATGKRPTRPQLLRALLRVKTAKPGAIHHIGDQLKLVVSARKYQISVL